MGLFFSSELLRCLFGKLLLAFKGLVLYWRKTCNCMWIVHLYLCVWVCMKRKDASELAQESLFSVLISYFPTSNLTVLAQFMWQELLPLQYKPTRAETAYLSFRRKNYCPTCHNFKLILVAVNSFCICCLVREKQSAGNTNFTLNFQHWDYMQNMYIYVELCLTFL